MASSGIDSCPAITILGDDAQSGAYVLRLLVHERLALSFGRFRGGKAVTVPAGVYLYIGSAMGRRGAISLGRRLVRHATRTGQAAPHPLRATMLETFAAVGLGGENLLPRNAKRCFWHIDYLLDQPAVELTHLLVIRSPMRLEARLAQLLEQDPYTHILAKGLGAKDVPGNTHLLAVAADAAWWTALPGRIAHLMPANLRDSAGSR